MSSTHFDVIPAIDIRGGQAVRLYQGDYGQETVYDADPVSVARRWVDAGAGLIHVVDLDAAREGRQVHLNLVRKICRQGARVQMGGGARDRASVLRAVEAGVSRVVLGTLAARDPDLAGELFEELGEQLVLGLDARDGVVSVDGWRSTGGWRATDLARRLVAAGARRIIYTDIATDGAGTGPSTAAAVALASATGVPIIASGGVGCLADIVTLREHAGDGLEGVIVGRALYTGAVDLAEAINAAGAAA